MTDNTISVDQYHALDDATVAALAAASGLSVEAVRYWVPLLPPRAADPAVRLDKLRAIAALRPPDYWYATFADQDAERDDGARRDTFATVGRDGRLVHRRMIVCAACGANRRHHGRGLCGICHRRATLAGTIADWAPLGRGRRSPQGGPQ